jgi:rubrerythrin
MKIIQMLEEMIEEELADAEHYAKKAIKFKEERPKLAETFYELSTEEMRHASRLHEQVVQIIEEHRKEHGAPPESMMAVYNYLHGRHIEHANKVKLYQNQYRGT